MVGWASLVCTEIIRFFFSFVRSTRVLIYQLFPSAHLRFRHIGNSELNAAACRVYLETLTWSLPRAGIAGGGVAVPLFQATV